MMRSIVPRWEAGDTGVYGRTTSFPSTTFLITMQEAVTIPEVSPSLGKATVKRLVSCVKVSTRAIFKGRNSEGLKAGGGGINYCRWKEQWRQARLPLGQQRCSGVVQSTFLKGVKGVAHEAISAETSHISPTIFICLQRSHPPNHLVQPLLHRRGVIFHHHLVPSSLRRVGYNYGGCFPRRT